MEGDNFDRNQPDLLLPLFPEAPRLGSEKFIIQIGGKCRSSLRPPIQHEFLHHWSQPNITKLLTVSISARIFADLPTEVDEHNTVILTLYCQKSSDDDGGTAGLQDYLIWCFGIFLLTFALFLSARMGIYQETLYAQFGKHPNEALFYSHALPLPGFLLLASDIYYHAGIFTKSVPLLLPVLKVAIPRLWIYLLGNVLTQYICIRSVFVLTTECTSLTVTLVITLRKFVSLIFSILYFKNPFTAEHWIGTALVFTGTMIFIDIFNIIQQVTSRKEKKTE